ncbi:unnamed protein product, partial [Didymodactylos carnosus]
GARSIGRRTIRRGQLVASQSSSNFRYYSWAQNARQCLLFRLVHYTTDRHGLHHEVSYLVSDHP